MFFRRYGTFTGGIDLPHEKHETLSGAIEAAAVPSLLRVPLSHGLAAAPMIVQRGQSVRAGQQLAGGGTFGVYSPVDAVVGQTVPVTILAPHGLLSVPAVELAPAAGACWPLLMGDVPAGFSLSSLSADTLRQRLADSHIPLHRRGGGDLGDWLEQVRRRSCARLVCNVMESQPYVTADHRAMCEHGRSVVLGLAMLARALDVRQVTLAGDQRHVDSYAAAAKAAKCAGVELVALPHKYPIGLDKVLVKVLARREVAPGGATLDVGVAVVDAATCLAAACWIFRQARCTGRVVTVVQENEAAANRDDDSPRGSDVRPALVRRGNFHVPTGTLCRELVGGREPIVLGGPMSGVLAGEDTVVTPQVDSVLCLSTPPPRTATPCIRCGWCTDHCPARLNVSMLNDCFELGLLDKARKMGVAACMACGVCSYICPASLPLAQRLGQLNAALAERRLAEAPR